MIETVEARFETPVAPKRVQWLTDNGPAYIANETVETARKLNLEPCTTPSYSPESNGMAEAFVKTFKQDYVWSADLSSAVVVMGQLASWFQDYNENAPHKGLRCYPRGSSGGRWNKNEPARWSGLDGATPSIHWSVFLRSSIRQSR